VKLTFRIKAEFSSEVYFAFFDKYRKNTPKVARLTFIFNLR